MSSSGVGVRKVGGDKFLIFLDFFVAVSVAVCGIMASQLSVSCRLSGIFS